MTRRLLICLLPFCLVIPAHAQSDDHFTSGHKHTDEFVELATTDVSKHSGTSKRKLAEGHTAYVGPNPTKSSIRIRTEAHSTITEINLVDLTGKVVLRHNTPVDQTTDLDCRHLPRGIYLLRMKYQDGTVQTQKFILQ